MINQKLVQAWATPNSRTAIVVPFQHGKSVLGSVYFPAWVLLLWPETRVALGSYEESFAATFGGKVRDIVNRFGPGLDPPRQVRADTSAKGEWVIDGFAGGMVCKGRGGALVGRPVDLMLLDDLIKNPLSVDTPIPTPSGWKLMGELKVGDEVFAHDGRPTKVTAVSERWKYKRNRVLFSDGSFVDAHPDHEWRVFDRLSHSVFTTQNGLYGEEWYYWVSSKKRKVKTVRTSEIANTIFTNRHMTNWTVPNALPLDLPNKELVVDPYVLGVWLGDGTSESPSITSHKDDTSHYVNAFERVGYYCRIRLTSPAAQIGSPDTRVIAFSLREGGDPPSHIADSAAKRLKQLGVMNNKHIPQEYLRASAKQRMELLCGLMDTDGTVGDTASFCNKNRKLVDGVHELLVSLGAKATIEEKTNEYGLYWIVRSTSMFCPFSLPRKIAKWEEGTGKPLIRRLNRTIVGVEQLDDEVEYVCITVAATSHLYLSGAGMVPTHNSEEAQSPTILDNIWDWYCTVAYSRLGPKAPIIGIGTRWGPKDLFGRWEAEAKVGGDRFDTLLLKAIADGKDPLGRQVGEALWPDRVPLARLQKIAQNRPRWFKTCWQGEPEESLGLHFQPREWPRYTDVGDAWRIKMGMNWLHYRKEECTIVLALDWAQKGKRDSDKTAFVVAAMTVDGLTLILSVFNGRLRYEENAPTLAEWCRRWEPENDRIIVVGEDDMLSDAMTVECRRYRDIPEIRRIAIKGKGKLVRAQAAIIRSQNGRFLLPTVNEKWYEEMCDQLTAFSGAEGAEDDIADCFGILGRIADEFSPGEDQEEDTPILGAEGYYGEWMG